MVGNPLQRVLATDVTSSLRKSRRLVEYCQKLKTYIVIPSFSLARDRWLGASTILFQFDYSAGSDFRLVDWHKLNYVSPILHFTVCIRYRVGQTVYRYKLFSAIGETRLFCPVYTGEIIKKHCVVEIWNSTAYTTLTLAEPFYLQTSHLSYPASCHDFSSSLIPTSYYADDDLFVNMVFPNTFSAYSSWITNGTGITADSTVITADSTTVLASDEG